MLNQCFCVQSPKTTDNKMKQQLRHFGPTFSDIKFQFGSCRIFIFRFGTRIICGPIISVEPAVGLDIFYSGNKLATNSVSRLRQKPDPTLTLPDRAKRQLRIPSCTPGYRRCHYSEDKFTGPRKVIRRVTWSSLIKPEVFGTSSPSSITGITIIWFSEEKLGGFDLDGMERSRTSDFLRNSRELTAAINWQLPRCAIIHGALAGLRSSRCWSFVPKPGIAI